MYFCKSLLLICISLILAVHTQPQKDLKGPGISSCCYSDFRQDYCNLPKVPVTDIPLECTSLMFNGVFMNLENEVVDHPDINYTILDELLKSGRKVFLYYGRGRQANWTAILANESCNGGKNSLNDMKGLKTFLDNHSGVTGLILTGTQYQVDSIEFPTYTENLKIYLDVLRNSFPKLIIGLDIFGFELIDQYTNPKFEWLDIKIIDVAIDFYSVTMEYFNSCSDDFKQTGTSPMTGSNTNHTLDKLKDVLQQACIPTEKTYFNFKINPSSPDDTLDVCDVNNAKMCTQPQTACDWCTDTQLSYNEKGQFAQKNGAGFTVVFIDFDDPGNSCKCEQPYPSFHAILDGFNSVSTKTCDLFNRT